MGQANDIGHGTGSRLVQRLVVIAVIAIVLRGIGFFAGPSGDGTFHSESRKDRAMPVADLPEEDDGWGTRARAGSSSSAALARARAAEAERRRLRNEGGREDRGGTPMYDPGKDGGWGSN